MKRDNLQPGQVWFDTRSNSFLVVYEVWDGGARVIAIDRKNRIRPYARRLHSGKAPAHYEPSYEGPKGV